MLLFLLMNFWYTKRFCYKISNALDQPNGHKHTIDFITHFFLNYKIGLNAQDLPQFSRSCSSFSVWQVTTLQTIELTNKNVQAL